MGNRASVIYFDRNRVSPTVYLHWHGDAVPAWLEALKERMLGRFGDADYAAARFAGICHANIEGNLSLGVSSNSLSLEDVTLPERMEEESPGNAGIVVVDTSNFTWKAYGGYLAQSEALDVPVASPPGQWQRSTIRVRGAGKLPSFLAFLPGPALTPAP